MYVIAGVSGNTGSVVAETLLSRNEAVRVIVRDAAKGKVWAERGAEVAVAELTDVGALTHALAGARGAYLLSPPDFGAPDFLASREPITDAIAQAARASAVPHVVFLSSIAAHLESGTGPILSVRAGERKLREAGVVATLLRPGYFFENWFGMIGLAKEQGVLPHFGPVDAPFAQISTRDIAHFAVEALLSPPTATRIWELAGPQDYAASDIAQALGEVLGRSVTAVEAPNEQVVPTFTSFGLSDNLASLYAEMYRSLAAGQFGFEGGSTPLRRGQVTPAEALAAVGGGRG